MVVLNCWFIVVFLGAGVCSKDVDEHKLLRRLDNTEYLLKALSDRVDLLEAQAKIHLQRISDLEFNDHRQQEEIEALSQQLQEYLQQAETPSEGESTADDERTNNERRNIQQKHHIERTILTDSTVPEFRQANVEMPVAFLALLSQDLTHIGVEQVIVFDKAVTNVGNGYNAAMGMFTAPVEGIYVFSATLAALFTADARSAFYHNNNRINVMYVNTDGAEIAGSTIALHLLKGDVVTVRNLDADDGVNGWLHSSFTGFLLGSYGSVQPVIGK